ncbi:hypothetical protein HDU98_006634 [Podochytrium sp. JEL0797]|nr:hypothetical protein HDU98_006634 [Podochytrium sp. JEL0797]
MDQRLHSEIAETQAKWDAAEAELSRLAVDDPKYQKVEDKVKQTHELLMALLRSEIENIKKIRPAAAAPGPKKKFRVCIPDIDKVQIWTIEDEKGWAEMLARNHVNIFATSDPSTVLEFDDIVSELTEDLKNKTDYKYVAQGTRFRDKLNDVAAKMRAYTDSVKSDGAMFLDQPDIQPTNHGLYHEVSRYQVWARHISEDNLRERDGFFLSEKHEVAVLMSAKVRFSQREMEELHSDVSVDVVFRPRDWFFKAEDGTERTLDTMKQYSWLKGKQSLKFVGFGYTPNVHPKCPLSFPRVNPRVFLFKRHIIYKPMSPIPVFVQNLLKHIK